MAQLAARLGLWSGRLKLPVRLLALIALALCLSLALSVILSFNLSRMRDGFAWVRQTNEVLRQLSLAERRLLEAESAERGYLLSGEGSYLESFRSAVAEVPAALAALQQMTSDNPAQVTRVSQLGDNIRKRLDELKRAVELGPTRLNEALAVLGTARSRQLAPEIERNVAEVRQVELVLLEQRQRAADESATSTTISAAALSIFIVLAVAIAAFLLQRQGAISELRVANEQLSRSRDELEEREAHLEAILATVPDAMVVIDEQGIIQSFSSAAQNMFGYSAAEASGKNVSVLMPDPYQGEHNGYLHRYLTTGERRIIGTGRVVVGQRRDGTTFPMELSIGEVQLKGRRHFVGFIRDLTQRQESERLLHEVQSEMFHMSRLSSMGEMASALAHELNQPLAAVSNYLQGARRLIDSNKLEPERLRDAMNKATDQALRAGQVIRRLRDFVSRGETDKRIEILSRMIEETSALALVSAKEQSVHVIIRFSRARDYVLVDKVQIQQVLLNLLRNALESMHGSSRRELTISTVAVPQDLIAIRIADTGSGIAPEVMEKLFQPFVTTKKQGMGVGLSICRTIVEAHGGTIIAEANPGGGTIFCVTLPVVLSDEVSA